MSNILFINETALKESSLINENVDMKMITPTIRLAQEKNILPLLGTGLYNDLKSAIQSDPTMASHSAYKTLLDDYVQPCLVWWVMVEMPVALTFRYMNKAVMNNSSENGQPAQMFDLLKLMDSNKNNAEWYSERVTRFLLANTSIYPLFDNPGNTIDTIQPNRRNYNPGIYLGQEPETFGLKRFSDREHYMK